MMEKFLKENGKTLIPKVNSVYRFDILDNKGTATSWIVDLKNGDGTIAKSSEGKPDATFTILDSDFMAMANKTLNPQQAFMSGKMKIKGNMAAAMKFTPDLLPLLPKI